MFWVGSPAGAETTQIRGAAWIGQATAVGETIHVHMWPPEQVFIGDIVDRRGPPAWIFRGEIHGEPIALISPIVDELPQAIKKVSPVYPKAALESRIEGTVLLQVMVGTDGLVKNMRVVKSIPPLDRAAEDAVRRLVFKPALARGKPVAVWVAVPVKFTLPPRN